MRITNGQIAENLKWFDQLKIVPDAKVARDLAIRALKDLQDARQGIDKLHDEIYECVHYDGCAQVQLEGYHATDIDTDECDCGFELVCDLAGVSP